MHIDPIPHTGERVLDQAAFRRMMSLERKRTERSGMPFVLMLLDAGPELRADASSQRFGRMIGALTHFVRETDLVGWYETNAVIGAVFSGLTVADREAVVSTISQRVRSLAVQHLTADQLERVTVSFHVFPEEWGRPKESQNNPMLYPELLQQNATQRALRAVKRAMDIVGSISLLFLGAPIFILIAIAVKVTSPGPVFYKQQRTGQYGIAFCLLKFRSMHVGNDSEVHKQYVQQLIAGTASRQDTNTRDKAVYKLTRDPRVTLVGRFLRKTSLDELPQFFNVLKGEMSLVGPRPPIDYEVERYEVWHRRRLLEAKPGITGLWQVNGRNRLGFDDMVRLDLRYAKMWSPWLDLAILLRTPKAMLEGAH